MPASTITEPTLVNPWGISHTTTSPFWISDQGTNFTNLWSVTGETNVTKVTAVNPPTGNIAIPTSGGGPAQGPTGQVANQNPSPSSFPVGNGGNGGSAHFIFANLNGTISAWRARFICRVRSVMISPAFSEALRIAVICAPKKPAVDSIKAR